jgi:hypothetical protein
MACDLKILNSYGDGSLGVVTNPSGQINSYANVTAIGALGHQLTIGTPSNGIYETFAVGKEIAIHVSAGNGSSTDTTYLGAKLHCKITAVSGSVLSIDKDFTAVLPAAVFENYQVQAITVANFKSLTLSSGSITPPAYSVSNKYGGIILAKCTDTVTFSGGSINLVDKGIPVASTAYRPRTAQEINGTADTDKYSGWENHETLRKFLLNAGDGAAMIIAKHYVQTGTASRIGGTTAGAQFVRGNVGGSTIALVCGDMSGFDPSIISKTKGSGQGLGRCYIASDTKLRNDEGLYAYDVISNPYRLMRTLNIKNYGDGSLGDVTNPTAPMNNYARVTAILADGKTIAYSNKTATGMAPIAVGALVMFHVSKHTDSSDMGYLSKFILAKILSDDGNNLILDTPVTNVFAVNKLSKYSCQIISIAQFNNLTISSKYAATTAWNTTYNYGGICAFACKNTCDLSGGQINVEGKGGGTAYAREGLAFIGNAQMCDILPIGQGHGSVFYLANNCKTNNTTNVGAAYLGTNFGGTSNAGAIGGYVGVTRSGLGGSGARGGDDYMYIGGYGSNGHERSWNGTEVGLTVPQGAHVFAVINNLTQFTLNLVSTGGGARVTSTTNTGNYGGAGYGGAGDDWLSSSGYGGYGGYNGGGAGGSVDRAGGGSSGWSFMYVNTVTTEDTTGVVAA